MYPKGIVSLDQRFEHGHIAVDRNELAIADVIAHRGAGIFTKTGRGILLYGLKPEMKAAFNSGDPGVLDYVLSREAIGSDTLITLADGIGADLFSGDFDVHGKPIDCHRVKGDSLRIVEL